MYSDAVPLVVARAVFEDHDCQADLVDSALDHYARRFATHFNVTIADREPLSYSGEQLTCLKDHHAAVGDKFLARVGVRFCRYKGDPPIQELLEELADNRRSVGVWYRQSAAKSLGAMGVRASEALPALRIALSDAEPSVQRAAADAIHKIEADSQR